MHHTADGADDVLRIAMDAKASQGNRIILKVLPSL
jgi:hypothetical protein